jgi:hypothetical protein
VSFFKDNTTWLPEFPPDFQAVGEKEKAKEHTFQWNQIG